MRIYCPKLCLVFFLIFYSLNVYSELAERNLTIQELEKISFLDDYSSNVVYGYHIVMDTPKYAPRYNRGRLSCRNCHLQAGTKKFALPLNILGMYPKWRAKNGKHNGIGLRIRECFLYSMNGLLPPENAPEVLAVAAYISYLSKGERIGVAPEGRGVKTIDTTGYDPNPSSGKIVYKAKCAVCHGKEGLGNAYSPPVAGIDSYNAGAGMNKIQTLAGFVWQNMPLGNEQSLTQQEALDVAAYLHIQLRGGDPRKGKLLKFLEPIGKWLGILE